MFAGLILLFSQTYLTSSSLPTSSPSSVSTCSPNPLTPPSLTDCRVRPTPVALQTPSEGETRFQLKTERFNLNIAFVLQTFSSSNQVSLNLTAVQVKPTIYRLWKKAWEEFIPRIVFCAKCAFSGAASFKLQAPARLSLHTSHKKVSSDNFVVMLNITEQKYTVLIKMPCNYTIFPQPPLH